MASTIYRIQTLEFELDTKPGSLSQVFTALKDAGVSVFSSWAFEMGPGQASGIIYPDNFAKAKDVLTKLGKNPKTGNAIYAHDEDKIGPYVDILQKISAAGVNINASDAFGIGGKFATVIFADDQNFPGLCKALGV